MKKLILPISLFVFFLQFAFGQVYAQEEPSNKLRCDQIWSIVGTDECRNWVVNNDEGGVWCNLPESRESLQPWIYGPAPTYTFTPGTCKAESEAQPEVGLETEESSIEVGKQKEQPKIGLPLFATGWLGLFKNLWDAAGVNPSSIIENINLVSGMDHTLCDPATCSKALEAVQRETNLSEEEIILRSHSAKANAANPYKLHKQSGDVRISDYDKSKGFIMVTGKDGVIFYTFFGLEDDIGGFEVSPNTKINLPPNPFQGAKQNSNQAPGQLPTKVELEFGEAEFFIIGSAEKSTIRPTFTVATPNVEVKVSGTHFWTSYDKDKKQSIVGVYEGQVEIKTKDGKTTTITPNGDKPGVVMVTQKLSVTKLAIVGIVLVAVIVGIVLLIRRKRILRLSKKKR